MYVKVWLPIQTSIIANIYLVSISHMTNILSHMTDIYKSHDNVLVPVLILQSSLVLFEFSFSPFFILATPTSVSSLALGDFTGISRESFSHLFTYQ